MVNRYALALLLLLACAMPAAADSNLHSLTGTMTDCWCQYFPTPADWVCWAGVDVTEPFATHVLFEIQGEALGQCSAIAASLPRKVKVLFWLQAAGPDYVRDIYRSAAQAYFFLDLGNP